ncbi:hypothetical protein V9T40_005981 [Parthenolecanium corni]|uniref:HMG box domain-containing protein n=1 Tax=Parthenolecanium corni TaxID=536013 RepID=A0AAN9TXI1_9HEMI
MSQSEVLTHIELPPATGVDYCSVEETSHLQSSSDQQISDDDPMTSAGLPEPCQSTQPLKAKSKKPIMDGEGHVCTKASVNPFFNLLRLYRSLPESKGKTAPQLAVEGACIWRAMTQDEKSPFQQAALTESKRRMNNREKRSKSTNDTKNRSYNRRSKEITKGSGRSTKVH